jgi:hypothetical protein
MNEPDEGMNMVIFYAKGFLMNNHQMGFFNIHIILESFPNHSPFTVSLWN